MSIHTAYKYAHYNKNGQLLWAKGIGDVEHHGIYKGTKEHLEALNDRDWSLNTLADEGEEDILDVYFDAQAVRTSLFLRLYNDTPTEADTLATLTGEVSGTGYGAITVTRGTDWTAPVAATGTDMTQKTFTATGTWTAATYLVVATVGTGTAGLLIAYDALAATRTLQNGDSLNIDLNVTLE